MSNVRIEATGEASLTVEVILGANSRAKHSVEAGQSVDLAVGGGQRLVVREFVAEGTTAAEEEGDLPTGVDVSDPDPADDSESESESDDAASNGEATAAPADWLSEGLAAAGASEPELETITSKDIGTLDVLDLEADSPLELGEAIQSPFEDEKAAEGQA